MNGPLPDHSNPLGPLAMALLIAHGAYLMPVLLVHLLRRTPLAAILGAVLAGFVVWFMWLISLFQPGGGLFVLPVDLVLISSLARLALTVGLPIGVALGLWTAVFVWPRWPRHLRHLFAWVLPALATVGLLAQNLLW
ncbi:hypothetical protein RIF23_15520 [Lipingzhangella sp. LS1_29]|uniref:Uncharacterized protein n=1 Tax=Lipingzhangella rawalii TaxID=2055835 RepID=A0ABU2HA21_9ACTN|nr:hypothetical protein [Lipingzhangella rawalii]MDS1271704.1 hypothetical protein [Lipingzhangella rawalii]